MKKIGTHLEGLNSRHNLSDMNTGSPFKIPYSKDQQDDIGNTRKKYVLSRFGLCELEINNQEIRGEGRNIKMKGRDAVVFAFWRSRNADMLQINSPCWQNKPFTYFLHILKSHFIKNRQ